MPKCIGFTNIQSISPDGKITYKDPKTIPADESIKMYISTNCLRHGIFKEGFPNHLSDMKMKHSFDLLKDPSGLLRGYAITDAVPLMRKSSLIIEKAVEKTNLLIETLTTTGVRDNTSLFAEVNAADTCYVFYGSVNIEELQFISTDNVFGRASILGEREEIIKLAQDITAMLNGLAKEHNISCSPVAEYNFWVKKGRVLKEGEWGILLNPDAIHLLVLWAMDKIENLYISQAKGHMEVDSVIQDYNSGKHFRIKRDVSSVISEKGSQQYEIYYERMTDKPTHSQDNGIKKDTKKK